MRARFVSVAEGTPEGAVCTDNPGRGDAMERKRIRKILLVQPPSYSNNVRSDMNPNVPLGIAYIAATLEKEGYQVKMLDAFIEDWHRETRVTPEIIRVGMSFEDIKAVIAAEAPDVVGVTSMFTFQRQNAHKIATLAKEVDPSIIVVFGGAHPTAAPEMVLPDPNVDVIVLGEGDNSTVPLLQTIETGGDLRDLDGIAFRNGSDLVINEKRQQITDLDSLPFPARHLLPMEKYFSAGVRHGGFSRRDRATSMITSRGCQYRCNFCTAFKVFTRLPRIRSVGNVMAEIKELVTKYGVNEIFFEDDQFLAKQKHTEELLDVMIASGYDVIWDTPNGISAWLLNERIIAKMAKAGCYTLNIAMESGNQWVLDHIINKPVKVEKLPELVSLIRKYGMQPGTFIVVGNIAENAVETKEQIRDSFRMARRLGVVPFISFLTPYPGSEVLEIAERKGYLVPGFDWDNLVISRQNLQTPEWSPRELAMLVEEEKTKTRVAFRISLWLKHPKQQLAGVRDRYLRNPAGFFKALKEWGRDLLLASKA
jgi:anaerobic magnesium-protoporphyrin IX monomethyl ester cyclase